MNEIRFWSITKDDEGLAELARKYFQEANREHSFKITQIEDFEFRYDNQVMFIAGVNFQNPLAYAVGYVEEPYHRVRVISSFARELFEEEIHPQRGHVVLDLKDRPGYRMWTGKGRLLSLLSIEAKRRMTVDAWLMDHIQKQNYELIETETMNARHGFFIRSGFVNTGLRSKFDSPIFVWHNPRYQLQTGEDDLGNAFEKMWSLTVDSLQATINRFLIPLEQISEEQARRMIQKYTAAIQQNFTPWLYAVKDYAKSPLAMEIAAENLNVELAEEHQQLLSDLAEGAKATPTKKDYNLMGRVTESIYSLISQKTELTPVTIVATLENTSTIFIPYLEGLARKCGAANLLYTEVHGEHDVVHALNFTRALYDEFRCRASSNGCWERSARDGLITRKYADLWSSEAYLQVNEAANACLALLANIFSLP